MTKQEVAEMLTYIKIMYPSFYKDQTSEALALAVNGWYRVFENYDYSIVSEAVNAYIVTEKFPPTPAHIIEKANLITGIGSHETELEAWNKVYKAICNSSYNAQEEFNKLSQDIQDIVGNPAQLREWARMESGQLTTVVSSNFQRSYRDYISRKQKVEALPQSAKQLMGKTDNKLLKDGK